MPEGLVGLRGDDGTGDAVALQKGAASVAPLVQTRRDPDDDLHNGSFGRCATSNGRLLTGSVLRRYEDDDDDEVCDVRLDVRPLRGAPQLRGTPPVVRIGRVALLPRHTSSAAESGANRRWHGAPAKA